MRRRCRNPRANGFKSYGGRGITVCERWATSFEAFFADMGPRPDGTSLDRVDNDRGYHCGKCSDCEARGVPANCRWATKAEQQQNMRTNVLLTINGETRCFAEWCRAYGIPPNTLKYRIRSGWPIDRCLVPAGKQERRIAL
jgi:hypothetical protein